MKFIIDIPDHQLILIKNCRYLNNVKENKISYFLLTCSSVVSVVCCQVEVCSVVCCQVEVCSIVCCQVEVCSVVLSGRSL